MQKTIENEMKIGGGTFIGCGLEMALELFNHRQNQNPLSALLLLTDGEDNEYHDYSQLIKTLPKNTPCHTFGYGLNHHASLLIQIAKQSDGGTFTYIVSLLEHFRENRFFTKPVPRGRTFKVSHGPVKHKKVSH